MKKTSLDLIVVLFSPGLVTATVASEVYKAAQPALLYLVPFTLLPILVMAYLKVRSILNCFPNRVQRALSLNGKKNYLENIQGILTKLSKMLNAPNKFSLRGRRKKGEGRGDRGKRKMGKGKESISLSPSPQSALPFPSFPLPSRRLSRRPKRLCPYQAGILLAIFVGSVLFIQTLCH